MGLSKGQGRRPLLIVIYLFSKTRYDGIPFLYMRMYPDINTVCIFLMCKIFVR